MEYMTPDEAISQVTAAYAEIDAAEQRYREALRHALAVPGVTQAKLAETLGRTREMLRQDAMTDEQREALRAADADRKRALREQAARARADG